MGEANETTVGATGPAELLERLVALHALAARSGLDPIELYHRRATTVRVEHAPGAATPEVQTGREDGLALRVHERQADSVVFVATSGDDERALAWLAARARHGYGRRRVIDAEDPWDGTEDRPADADPEGRLPSPAEIGRWTESAFAGLPSADPAAGFRTRVEVAATVETWVSTAGRKASRSRVRAWAVAEPPEAAAWGAGPLILAARGWDRLPADGWGAIAADRVWPAGSHAVALPERIPTLFSPEASATLVAALVGEVHGSTGRPDDPVGPGWRVRDEPFAPAALLGGAFDDACFDCRPRWLADGRRVVGLVGGPGSWRRASFRDAPSPMPCHVVVTPPPTDLPPTALLVTGLRIHPLEAARWSLEFRGGLLRHGEPGPAIPRGHATIAPRDLIARCVAGFGPGRTSWRGVETPALLFDGLRPILMD